MANAQLKNLEVSNTDPDKLWVVFSGYSANDKVFTSNDGGNTWINLSTGLPNIPMNCIVAMKNDPNEGVYLGADIGVYYYNTDVGQWISFFNDLPNCAVTDLEIFYPSGKLRAATYGRSAWESDLYTGTSGVEEIDMELQILTYPNPANEFLTIESTRNQATIEFEIVNLKGQFLFGGKFTSKTTISTSKLENGVYFIKFNNGESKTFQVIR